MKGTIQRDLPKSRCEESARRVYPPRRIRQRNVEGKAPWRVLDMTISRVPQAILPETMSDKVEGVSTFSLGVLVRGHGIHIYKN